VAGVFDVGQLPGLADLVEDDHADLLRPDRSEGDPDVQAAALELGLVAGRVRGRILDRDDQVAGVLGDRQRVCRRRAADGGRGRQRGEDGERGGGEAGDDRDGDQPTPSGEGPRGAVRGGHDAPHEGLVRARPDVDGRGEQADQGVLLLVDVMHRSSSVAW
jgi:hypothetical protein